MITSPRWPALRATALTALLCLGLLGVCWWLTQSRIAAAQRRQELARLTAVLPREIYDNDPLRDRILVTDRTAFGHAGSVPVLRARLGGAPSALVLEATVAQGYAGPIRLLLGVDYAGRILGVRIVEHAETPGLGDAFATDGGRWLAAFAQRSLDDPPAQDWKLKKDGGYYDQFSGATVTPRAIVTQLRKTLEYCAAHRDALFAPP